jgi:hypothetical protein
MHGEIPAIKPAANATKMSVTSELWGTDRSNSPIEDPCDEP